ncbi:hypothetical protein EMGBS8_12610 [Verrucomicrobiota bacterium]|nr:hypothetical protein EMGBS8_12610 [Verrucomicrobiota bacterium]
MGELASTWTVSAEPPRVLPGFVVEARKSLGDKVAAGEVVARVENSQTLVSAEVKAPGAGVVIARTAAAARVVAEGAALYTIAGLDKVWVELEIPSKDLGRVKAGQAVVLHADDGREATQGRHCFRFASGLRREPDGSGPRGRP